MQIGLRGRWVVVALAVAALAFGLRVGYVLRSAGGPGGNFGYDASVYYAAADALIHGRLPYRDFVLLHPPLLMLVLSPFAALGRLTTDHTGFIVANTAFSALGALNAALVVAVGRRLRLPLAAAAAGGVFYAVWLGAVSSEVSTRLEPLGTLLLLLALLALTGAEPRPTRALVLAGAALGGAASVKIWWVVPLLVVLVWRLRAARDRRGTGLIALGAAGAMVLVYGPFLLAARGAMVRMVVLDQIGRAPANGSPFYRLASLSSLTTALHGVSVPLRVLVLLFVAVALVAAGVAAWRAAAAYRLVVSIAAAQLVVLMLSPSFFGFYAGFLAASVSLVVACAAAAAGTRGAHRPAGREQLLDRAVRPAAAALVAAAAVLTAIAFVRPITSIAPYPGARLARATAGIRCVMADSPMALIELNALSRGLANGCRNWVDVTGRTYGADAPGSHHVSRPRNQRWQRDLRGYLLSGDAVTLIRKGTGASRQTLAVIGALPVLARAGHHVVHLVPPARRVAP